MNTAQKFPNFLLISALIHCHNALITQGFVYSPLHVLQSSIHHRTMGWATHTHTATPFPKNYSDYENINPENLDPQALEQYELMKAEEEFYRQDMLRNQMKEMPMEMECHQYRWKQTEDFIDVEIPIPKMVIPKDIYLVLTPEEFCCELRNDLTFIPVEGFLMGEANSENSSWTVEPAEKRGGYVIKVRVMKNAQEGTYALWYGFLEDEEPSPTVAFEGKTNKYSWKQNLHTIEVEITVPSDVTKKGVHFDIDAAGKSFRLSMDEYPSYGILEGNFFGKVSVADSIWLLDGEEENRKLCAVLKKKRRKDNIPEWWSSLMENEANM
mmetsp:Transcript_2025/g.2631  ORF Transcript_2025/g.2631 Transcript_2025/m.2631 type:complete len:325 (+) Transcript_2025:106-1080(+)